jgi:hypothetical protein
MNFYNYDVMKVLGDEVLGDVPRILGLFMAHI